MTDTIYALASAPGKSGVAVVRVSGPQAVPLLHGLTRKQDFKPRGLHRVALRPVDSPEVIDQALAAHFPAPGSFTGEEVVEFHVHGGRAVLAALFQAFSAFAEVRPAAPGEFSRRAFVNGKMDLTEAEGLADLIDAQTQAQRRQALRQMGGALAGLYDRWRERLVDILAHCEALIDFAEDDIPQDLALRTTADIQALIAMLQEHLADNQRGEIIREGVSIVLLGPPNAGKSSLMNALARREAAIVAAEAGTTRDVIEVQLDLGGYAATLADTAGLREATGDVEREGIRRARARAEAADIRLVIFDGARWPDFDLPTAELIDADTLVVLNKTDLLDSPPPSTLLQHPLIGISVTQGVGLDVLQQALQERIAQKLGCLETPVLSRVRHRVALSACLDHLQRSLGAAYADQQAEDLRLAARALGRITGRVEVEEILDVIFSQFCIGK